MATRTQKRAPAKKHDAPRLTSLTGDWYWEQDAALRFTRVEVHGASASDQELASALLGKRRWETGIECDGGWDAHRRLVRARAPFRDTLMWRTAADGARRYILVSGEPMFDGRGCFLGYHGIGRDVTRQKRGEQLLALQHEITRRTAEASLAAEGVQSALQAICENEGWDCGEFWRLDVGGMRRFAQWAAPAVPTVYLGRDLIDIARQAPAPRWLVDLPEATGLQAAVLCPVSAAGEIVAVLAFGRHEVRRPDEELQQALMAIATQLGLFLRRADAEARLRESEERFRHTFELAGVGVAHIGLDRRFERVNRRFAEILGYPEAELVGITGREISHPDDKDHMNAHRPRLYAGAVDAVRGEKRYMRKDGSVVWVAYTLAVERDAAGKPLYEIAVYDDITARKAMEQALRDSEAHFRQVVDSANEGILVYDRDLNIVAANAAAAQIIGVPAEQLIGAPGFTSLLPSVREDGSPLRPDDRPSRLTMQGGKPLTGMIVGLARPGGRISWLSVDTGFLRRPEASEPYGIVATLSDITAQKRGEQLLRLEHQVTRAFAEATDISHALKGALRAICESEHWDCARYLGLDAAASELRLAEAWSVENADIQRYLEHMRGMVYAPGVGIVGRVWQSGQPLWVADVTQDARAARPGIALATGMRGAFAAPVISEGRTIGVCIFQSREIREPDERLLQAIRVIGGQIGQLVHRAQAEQAMRDSESRFRSLTEMSSDFFWETDAQHRFVEMVHGRSYSDDMGRVIGKTPWELPYTFPEASGWAGLRTVMDEHRPVRDFEFGRPGREGSVRWFAVSGDPHYAPDGRFLGYRGVGRNITDTVLARERIASLAYHDGLTGLDNRASLAPALEKAIDRTRRRATRLAGLFLDLDGFKQVNDLYGHDAGDRLLVEVARRLRAALRSADPVARLGGDEFFVVLEDLGDAAPAERVAAKLLAAVNEPYDLGVGKAVDLSASIGISLYPDDAGDAATLIKHADTAMYSAKQAGKNSYRFFAARPAANDGRGAGSERSGGEG